MKNIYISIISLFLFGVGTSKINAQMVNPAGPVSSASSQLIAHPIPDRTILYSLTDPGIARPIIWGLDLAWLSEGNIRRGIAFMGADRVDVVRSSFRPTAPLVNGELTAAEQEILNERLQIINTWFGPMNLVLNSDHPSVDTWYKNGDGTVNAARWAQLIDLTTRLHQEEGHNVVTVSPFNEPDYGWGQGDMQDFYNIAGELKNIPLFEDIRISGGNTLSSDAALPWYNFLKDRLDEGNTHQLAGSFDNYAAFFQAVRANGDHATNDELHNVMEAMVGVEYGMQTGIWWGTAERARGEFVKISEGVGLGYAEHRPNWTAASVYRGPDGKIQAFGGTSERQAVTTTYRFVSKERDVYYDGYGPQREFTLVMPGGTGYQQGQTNAERVIDITWGDDIQPAISGKYLLVNRSSGMVMEVEGGSANAGANLQQGNPSGGTHQQWNVSPVSSRVVGDFSYFTLTAEHSGKAPDILNWSLDNGANIIVWDDVKGGNQQWYFEYEEDGWFYIRSRHSAKCLTVADASSADGANIIQFEKEGGASQQWRFIPVDAAVEFDAPAAPGGLLAQANAASIRLDWQASPATDLAGYTIFRSESAGGPYNTIARNITTTSFVDNTATSSGGQYFYAIKAVDHSLNRSDYSNEVSAAATGENELVGYLPFDGNTHDHSSNLNHSVSFDDISYAEGRIGSGAVALNGTDDFVQLPATVANHQEITIAAWVYWNGGSSWQRIFDFGNSQTEYMFLSPSSGSGNLRFAIKNGGDEQGLDAAALTANEWAHLAVSLGTSGARMYVNGELVDESAAINISPLDFKPVLNYIGRSQYPDPLFNGRIDEFRLYNYVLSADEVSQLAEAQYMVVESIISGVVEEGQEAKRGYAEVTILDHQGNALEGAPVTGTFSGSFNESVSGLTSSDGSVILATSGKENGEVSFEFCVDNIQHPIYTYNPMENQVSCKEFQEEIISGINDQEDSGVNIFPNPAGETLYITMDYYEKPVEISVVDMFGRVLLQKIFSEAQNQIDLNTLEQGIYIVRVKMGSKLIKNQKFIRN